MNTPVSEQRNDDRPPQQRQWHSEHGYVPQGRAVDAVHADPADSTDNQFQDLTHAPTQRTRG